MANRRITNSLATQAAMDMQRAVYKSKLDAAKDVVDKAVEEFVIGYLPAPVIACVNEYKEYFETSKSAYLYIYDKEPVDGRYNGSYQWVEGKVTFNLPITHYSNYQICTTKSKCKKIISANEVYRKLQDERDNFTQSVLNTLLSLKTEKRIAESFPEALPYIKFPDDKSNLPAPVFTSIRQLLQNVAANNNNKE